MKSRVFRPVCILTGLAAIVALLLAAPAPDPAAIPISRALPVMTETMGSIAIDSVATVNTLANVKDTSALVAPTATVGDTKPTPPGDSSNISISVRAEPVVVCDGVPVSGAQTNAAPSSDLAVTASVMTDYNMRISPIA